MAVRRSGLAEAIDAHTRPGDSVHVVVGHTRWTAAARALVRHWWGRDPGFELVMASLSSLGTLFFRGGLVRRVVTGYSGDIFPTFSPNPVYADAYRSGAVEVEHWSFLALVQRLRAAAEGLPAVTTRSIEGSSMADNEAYTRIDTPNGSVGMLAPLTPDICLLHAAAADRDGNLLVAPPVLEGVWGAWAARRGVIATVERIVDDLRPWASMVQVPGHRVLAVCEAPMGAHPGGLYAPGLPVEGYGEDLDFWADVRAASRGDSFDEWIRRWVLEPATQEEYLDVLGGDRREALAARADSESWRADAAARPVDRTAPANAWEVAAALGAREVTLRCADDGVDAVLAGAGVANLAAWSGVAVARERGSAVVLAAELGLWGYEPTPADPYIFNHRAFPSATMVADSELVLGTVVGGPGTRTLGCLGAAQLDRHGNVNSTDIAGGPFLVGSGGGNDVASAADDVVVVTTLAPRRTPSVLGYITSPGRAVSAVCTDLGVLRRDGDELVLTDLVRGVSVDDVRAACGWDLRVADALSDLAPPADEEVARLRAWDPTGIFLRPE